MPNINLTAKQKKALVTLREQFNQHIKFIADRTYLQKMQPTSNSADVNNFDNRQFKEILEGKKPFITPPRSQGLVRDLHGLRHATRVTLYTEMLHRFRSTKIVGKSGKSDNFAETAVGQVAQFFDITPQDVLMLTKFAAFFHDSARESDGKDLWDHRSAENCYDFLVQQGVNQQIARFFANAARYKGDKDAFNQYLLDLNITEQSEIYHFNYIRQLIALSDTLDIMRCTNEFNGFYLDNFFRTSANTINREVANKFMLGVNQLMAAQGDLRRNGCGIKISKSSSETLSQNSVQVEWDAQAKLNFEFSEDPYSFMQNYINAYIDAHQLEDLPKTEPLVTPGFNLKETSLIAACDWPAIFQNNQQFSFIPTDNNLEHIGTVVSKEEPSKNIININKDNIEFLISGSRDNDNLSIEHVSATIDILKTLVAQGSYDASNPLIIEPNQAFTVNMMATLMDGVRGNNIPVACTASIDSSPEMRKIIEQYNNEINWHPHIKRKTLK